VIHLDSSVALAHLLVEDRVPPAALWTEPLVSSRLLEYELWTCIHAPPRPLARGHGSGASWACGVARVGRAGRSPSCLPRS
jgi:hypothetical protein